MRSTYSLSMGSPRWQSTARPLWWALVPAWATHSDASSGSPYFCSAPCHSHSCSSGLR